MSIVNTFSLQSNRQILKKFWWRRSFLRCRPPFDKRIRCKDRLYKADWKKSLKLTISLSGSTKTMKIYYRWSIRSSLHIFRMTVRMNWLWIWTALCLALMAGRLMEISRTCGFQNWETIRTADTHVHFYCYKHGYGTLSDHPVLLWQGQDGKLH